MLKKEYDWLTPTGKTVPVVRGTHNEDYYECVCHCQKVVYASLFNLNSQYTISCGCTQMRKPVAPAGTAFGYLLTTGITKLQWQHTQGRTMYESLCVCDRIIYVSLGDLKRGHRWSCGCHKYAHGLSKTRIAALWRNMLNKCHRRTHKSYEFYGAKGIEVSRNWRHPYTFIEWAEANGYDEHLMIDRIDRTRGFFPKNCHWIDGADYLDNVYSKEVR